VGEADLHKRDKKMKAQYNPNMHTIKIQGYSSRRSRIVSIYIHISRTHIKFRDSLNGRLQHIIFFRRKALLYFFFFYVLNQNT
jgi:hypothetical protein